MKFLVDNQLPVALARFLTARGLECLHVLDVQLAESSDSVIWGYACQNDYVVISKDADFLYLAKARDAKGRLIWIRIGNCRTKPLLAAMEILWPKVEAALAAGDRIIELR